VNKSLIGSVALAGVIALAGVQVCIAQPSAAVCDDGGQGKPEICVRFDNLEYPPDEGTDFDFVLGDPDNPGVHLIRGSDGETTREWRVWSWDDNQTQTPKNIGTIEASNNWNYQVKLLQPDGDDGAEDLKVLDLDPTSDQYYSEVPDGSIARDLTEKFFLQRYDGNGGQANFTIGRDVDAGAEITLPRGEGFTVERLIAGYDPNFVYIYIGEINGGNFTVGSEVRDAIFTSPDPEPEPEGLTITNNGQLRIGYDISGRVWFTIEEMGSGARLKIGYERDSPSQEEQLVFITVKSDLPANAGIDMENIRAAGNIDFGTNDILGDIVIYSYNQGDITAKDLTGTIDIMDWFSNDGNLKLSGSMSGSGKFRVNKGEGSGKFRGDVQILGNMSGDAKIKLYKGTNGEFSGIAFIEVLGGSGVGSDARIVLQGDAHGSIDIDGDLAGQIKIGTGEGSGRVYPTCSIEIGGAQTGDIKITGNVDDGASITVGELDTDGRILIDGLCDGDILVEEGTAASSLIRAIVGLDDNGTIRLNTSQQQYDVYGTIHIGNPDLEVQDDIVFDGCIRIYDEDEQGNNGDYGNLYGSIVVNGCHDPANQLNICVDGGIDTEAENVFQTGCDPQIEEPWWLCTGCPP